jgi:hypothetical protein
MPCTVRSPSATQRPSSSIRSRGSKRVWKPFVVPVPPPVGEAIPLGMPAKCKTSNQEIRRAVAQRGFQLPRPGL